MRLLVTFKSGATQETFDVRDVRITDTTLTTNRGTLKLENVKLAELKQ